MKLLRGALAAAAVGALLAVAAAIPATGQTTAGPLVVAVSPTSAPVGATLSVTVSGCPGGRVDVGLIPGTDPQVVPTISTGAVAQPTGGLSLSLLVPATTPLGPALVKGACALDGVAATTVPITVVAATPSTTVPPPTTVPSTTTAPPPVVASPDFTG